MHLMWASLVLVAAVLTASPPGHAQDVRLPAPVPPLTSAEAFADGYGARLVDEFARILGASVNRSCLASRGVAAPDRERAREWLTRYGQRLIDRIDGALDGPAALAAFISTSGAGAPAELETLAQHPQVRAMNALSHRTRLDIIADQIVELLDQHLVIQRARLSRRFSPLATGATELLLMREEREEATNQALERFLAENSAVPELERFLELSDAWATAARGATNLASIQLSVFDGIVEELRASCIAGHPG